MKIKNVLKKVALWSCFLSVAYSCDNSQQKPNTITKNKTTDAELRIHEADDPDGMNPHTTSSARAEYIHNNLFQKLLKYDPESLDLVPQLAVSLPEITILDEGEYAGGMSLTYEIHPKAVWDNGTAITGEDYVFTIKAIKNPKANTAKLRPYVLFINAIEVDPTNPKKFTIFSKERYFKAEESSGQEPFILPEYHYDPEGIMRQFTIAQLNEEDLDNNPSIQDFATFFNGPILNRKPVAVVGSGAYTLKEWKTGERIVLERKKDWWGDAVKDNKMLTAFPPKITYRIFRDWNTAITNAKDGQIDVLRSIPPNNFSSLKENTKFSATFDLNTPDQFVCQYIGFNTTLPQLSDKKVRRAIAHLLDRDDLIASILDGMAVKTNGPINPRKDYYNKDLKNIEYNPELAKKLLNEAGWKDSDSDNILDKMIGGKKVDMKISYKYNQGHLVRKSIGLILKDEAKRVGIEVELTAVDFTSLLEDADNKKFDMLALAWVNTPGLDDMKQVWHSDAINNGGSNRLSFGTAESDRLIDEIRVTLEEDKQNELYQKVQEIIYEEQPCIFLFVPRERIAIHNRFEGTKTSPMGPGYTEGAFKLRN